MRLLSTCRRSFDRVRSEKCVQLKKTVEQPVEGIVITVGVGVALVEGEEDYDEVFSRADRGLYRDKKEW